MMQQPKPCPFCGSRRLRTHYAYPLQLWTIACMSCGGRMTGRLSREHTIKEWDHRYHEAD